MRKIVSACLAGFVVGLLQSLYFTPLPESYIEVIASPLILFATVVGLGSGLAATESDNTAVTVIAGAIVGIVVYSFLGYYSGLYTTALILGIISGVVSAFIAAAV